MIETTAKQLKSGYIATKKSMWWFYLGSCGTSFSLSSIQTRMTLKTSTDRTHQDLTHQSVLRCNVQAWVARFTHSVSFDSRKSRSSRESTSSLSYRSTIYLHTKTITFLHSIFFSWLWRGVILEFFTWGPAGPRSPGLPGLPDSPWKQTGSRMVIYETSGQCLLDQLHCTSLQR